MSIRLEDEKASLMGEIDGTTQLPIAYEPMEKEHHGCRSKGKCAVRLVVRLAFTIIAICGTVFFLKYFSPLPNVFGEGAHNPLRYYPGKDQAAELPIPTSIPTSLPKPPSPPHPPHLPDHIPHHIPHHPPHGPPLPIPIECLDISDAKASVNLSLTLDHPWSAIHLDRTLEQATINIQHEESSGPTEEHDLHTHPHGPPPPPHHPHGPPPPPPHHPHGPPPGKPETVMVTISRTAEKPRQTPLVTATNFNDEKKENKDKKVYVCALKLPFAGTGLGLFHHKPTHKKHEGSPEEPVPPPPPPTTPLSIDDKEKEPKDPHGPIESNFPAVSLAFRFPAGAPFNIKSGLPPPPPPPFGRHGHHKGLPWWHHKDDKDRKESSKTGFMVVITKMVSRVGCAGRRMMAKGE